jgi:hypothetical protein
MQAQHFKTDRQLWVCFAFVAFAALWFVPMIPFPDETVRPYVCWIAIFKTPTAYGWAWKDGFHILKDLPFIILVILVMSLILSIPSLVVGWVIQGLVVLFRQIKMDRHDHTA